MQREPILAMKPGEIYWAELDSGRRPVAIVSRESLNRGTYVQIVPFTSSQLEFRARLPNCVPFSAGEFGLPKACIAQCEMLTTIEKTLLDSADRRAHV